MLSIFSYVFGPSVCLPWRSVCSRPLPYFDWVVCLPGVQSCEFFIYFQDETLVWGIIGKYVFQYCGFSLYFNAVFFSPAERFFFDEVPFVYSFLYVPCLRDISVKILLYGISEIFLPMFFSRLLWCNLYLSLLSILSLFCVRCKLVVKFHFFCM